MICLKTEICFWSFFFHCLVIIAVSGLSIIFSLVLSISDPTIQIKKYMTNLRWLKTVSSMLILMGHYSHSLSLEATTIYNYRALSNILLGVSENWYAMAHRATGFQTFFPALTWMTVILQDKTQKVIPWQWTKERKSWPCWALVRLLDLLLCPIRKREFTSLPTICPSLEIQFAPPYSLTPKSTRSWRISVKQAYTETNKHCQIKYITSFFHPTQALSNTGFCQSK